jgi:hypothetical protein
VTLHRDTSLPYRDRSVTPKCYADKPLLLHVKYRAGSFGRLLAEIEVSHPSVPLRQTVILRRDTSNPMSTPVSYRSFCAQPDNCSAIPARTNSPAVSAW